jgi:opacity protein-like surface antigen
MRIPFLPFALVLLGSSLFAHDEDGRWYVQFGLGGVFSDKAEDVPGGTVDFDPGYDVSAALGRHLPLSERFGLDLEIEGYYQNFTVDEDDILQIPSAVEDDAVTLAWMANAILEWHFTPQFALYAGGGLGYATTADYDAWDSGNLEQVDDDGAAFQGKVGFLYELGGSYDFLLGYRYFRTEELEIENLVTGQTSDIDVGQHVVEATFRWGL